MRVVPSETPRNVLHSNKDVVIINIGVSNACVGWRGVEEGRCVRGKLLLKRPSVHSNATVAPFYRVPGMKWRIGKKGNVVISPMRLNGYNGRGCDNDSGRRRMRWISTSWFLAR